MQLKLTPADVSIALLNYLRDTGIKTAGQMVTFDYVNKRKSGGIYVEVNIGADAVNQPALAVVDTTPDTPIETSTEPPVQPQQAEPVTASLFG